MDLQPPAHDPPERLRYGVEQALSGESFVTWIPGEDFATSSLERVPAYPAAIGDTETRFLSLDAARNERRSAQVAVAGTDGITDLRAVATSFEGPSGAAIPADDVSVRYVGYVPVEETHPLIDDDAAVEDIADTSVTGDRAPDLVGDPLFPGDAVDVPPGRAQAVWVTFDVPEHARAGSYQGEIGVETAEHDPVTYDVELTVRGAAVPDPGDGSFNLDVWLNPDAVASAHDVDPWSADHWSLLDAYFEDLAAASQRPIPAAVVHEPWQREWVGGGWRSQTATGFSSLVEWRYDGEWSFGFDRFDRFVAAALDRGFGPSISAYSMLSFRGPQRLSYRDANGEFVVERIEAGADRWRTAWTAFLDAFGDHLAARGWLDRTYLAFDERPSELMDAALAVAEAAPHEFEDRIRIAGSLDVESVAEDLSVHYAQFPLDRDVVEARRGAGRTTTFYGAVPVRHPRTLSYSPAVESRMLPWIAAANGLDGVVRWSYNSWPADVFANPLFRYPQGAEYLVYPGRDGPLSSVRWELLREGIGEFELVRAADPDLDDALELAARDPDGREKDLTDLTAARERVFAALE